MQQVFQYYQRVQSARGNLTGLPSWARSLVILAALPGIALIALSVLALGVSILALLLLTVPAYSLLRSLTATRETTPSGVRIEEPGPAEMQGFGGIGAEPAPGRRRVEATVVEPDQGSENRT